MLRDVRALIATQGQWSEGAQPIIETFATQAQYTSQSMQSFQTGLLAAIRKDSADFNTTLRAYEEGGIDTSSNLKVDSALALFSGIRRYQTGDRREELGPSDKQRLFELFTDRSSRHVSRSLAQLIGDLLDVEIEIYKDGDTHVVQLNEYLHTANGSGIRGALRLVFDLSDKKPHVALIEEPELHLHPTLARAVAAFLIERSGSTQQFITSHSAEFVDAGVIDSSLFLVESLGDETITRHVSLPSDSGQIMTSIGLRPSSVLMYDRLILVEGASDEEVFRSLAKTLKADLARRGVGFINLRGGKNHHFVSQEILTYLEHSQGRTWCVLDSDEMLKAEIESCYKRFSGITNTKLFILRKREIENYLFYPYAILSEINRKRVVGGLKPTITIEEVDSAINGLDGILREECIRLRARAELLPHLRFPHGIGTDEVAVKLETKLREMEALLKSLPAALDAIHKEVSAMNVTTLFERVPGTFALEHIYGHFEVAFTKADSGTLARQLREADIDNELKEILKQATSA
jgi:putative ATP-dependent endonuclease of the OLD family